MPDDNGHRQRPQHRGTDRLHCFLLLQSLARHQHWNSEKPAGVRANVAVPLLTLRERSLEIHVDVEPASPVGILGSYSLQLRHRLSSNLPTLFTSAAPILRILGKCWPISHSAQSGLGPSCIPVSADGRVMNLFEKPSSPCNVLLEGARNETGVDCILQHSVIWTKPEPLGYVAQPRSLMLLDGLELGPDSFQKIVDSFPCKPLCLLG